MWKYIGITLETHEILRFTNASREYGITLETHEILRFTNASREYEPVNLNWRL